MQLTLTQLDFSVSINACHDQIMHKMEVLTNMEIQLLRKFQHQLGNLEMHFQMIHDVRVMIVNLQEVYKDVKQYFQQMGIPFVYDFFRKIQVLMVCGYNFMSQALLVNVDKIQDKKNKQSAGKGNFLQCKTCKCTCPQNGKNKKRQIKQVQHYDYKISMLQNEQQKLASQIQNIYQKMMMQKSMIQKTKPSLAIRELQDMRQHIENVMQSTNSIFQQTYMMKYVEFKNYLTQIKKPDDIVDYFITNMTFNVKQKFLKAMQKAIYKAQHMQQQLQRKHLKDMQIQTDKIKQLDRQSTYKGFSSLKPQKNSTLLTKQRKYNQKMMAQVQFIRKQLNSLMADNQKLKKQTQAKQAQRLKFQQNYQTLQQLYTKRMFQLQTAQNQNKWLISQKQNQSKKLRLEIKELKKQQVQTHDQQTQTFIPPNYVSSSTQTQIIYFQNQVDNQIINVLKKTNQRMIISLNEKQKKIRQLKTSKDQALNLKECKILCVGFLQDLREVTTYKMTQLNKQNNPGSKNSQKISTAKEPIIPLNQLTSNNSIMLTITKLTDQIKILLLNSQSNNKQRILQKRKSSLFKNDTLSQSSRRSSKMSDRSSPRTSQIFFKNSTKRKSNLSPSLQKDADIFSQAQLKQSIYKRQYQQKNDHKRSGSQSSISSKNSESNIKILEREDEDMLNSFEERIQKAMLKGKSNFSCSNSKKKIPSKQKIHVPIFNSVTVQTDLLKIHDQKKSFHQLSYKLYGEYSQQTDITVQGLDKFQQKYHSQTQELIKLKNSGNNLTGPYQSYSSRKHPYVRKPGGRLTVDKLRSQQSERNFISVNHSMPMNENQISLNIQESISKTKEQISFFNNNPQFINEPALSSFNRPSNASNVTLQSRLSALINPKNRLSTTSNLVVFKKPNQAYTKRSSQMVFDELKLDKHLKDKQKQQRNASFNSYKNDSILLSNTKQWTQMINAIQQQTQTQKQNIYKAKNQVHLKSIFIEKILQEDQNFSNTKSNFETLIDVSKKTPIQRERRISPKSYQPAESVFARTVKQMLLSSQSKEQLKKRIQEVYESLQKQKNKKKLKKLTKGSYAPRNSDQRKNQKKNKQVSFLSLGKFYIEKNQI